MLRRQRAIEIVPSSKPLRWRRYDVPQHLAPETSERLGLSAVESDLELLDRYHRCTIVPRAADPKRAVFLNYRWEVVNVGGGQPRQAPDRLATSAALHYHRLML